MHKGDCIFMKKTRANKVLCGLVLLGAQLFGFAEAVETEYLFSVVPQQSASKTAKTWGPVVRYLAEQTGHNLRLRTYKSIDVFERALHRGEADLSYMNPLQYVTSHEKQGYLAFAKAKGKRIKGILVVKKDSPIHTLKQLDGTRLAFPSPGAFAATLLVRADLLQQGVSVTPVYVRSHDSGYLNVTKGRFVASGGVLRTFNNMDANVRDQLRILHTTSAYTPHAIAAHPRVPAVVVTDVQQALLGMAKNENGRKLLQGLKIKAWEKAQNNDWDDVRALNFEGIR